MSAQQGLATALPLGATCFALAARRWSPRNCNAVHVRPTAQYCACNAADPATTFVGANPDANLEAAPCVS